jgi:hypothetical protein
MIAKERLIFDTSNISESDKVGSFILSASGTVITHTTEGGKEALDVNIANASVVVSATNLDIRDLAFATDKVDVSGSSVSISGDVNVTQGTSPWVVSATNLDIRDLAFATDKVDVSGSTVELGATTLAALETITVDQGTSPWVVSATNLDIRDLAFATDKVDVSGSSVSISGDVNVTQGTSPWVVSATDLDIRDLAAATDSVSAWTKDGSGNSIGSVAGALNVNLASSAISIDVQEEANTAIAAQATSVTSTSAALLASQQAGRKYLFVQNLGNRSIYIGPSGVSTASGLRLSGGSVAELRLGPALSLHAVTDSGSQDTRLLQLA